MNRIIFVFCLFFSLPVFAQTETPQKASLSTLFEDFKRAVEIPCGKRGEAMRIGGELVKQYAADHSNEKIVNWVQKTLPIIAAQDKECRLKLVADYNLAIKKPCGERNRAVDLGKEILDLETDQTISPVFRQNVKYAVAKIETEDWRCNLEKQLDLTYKSKNWHAFLRTAKSLIGFYGRMPRGLDLRLAFVKTAYDLTAHERDDTFNDELVDYAEYALEKIEGGANSGGEWGIYDGFKTRENTLGWLNYILGYVDYFRLDRKDRGIEYLYRATLYKCEFKHDAFMYQAAAIYYFEKETITVSGLSVREFFRKAEQAAAEPAQPSKQNERRPDLVLMYKKLGDLYNLRYNLDEDEYAYTFEDYIQKLIARPLRDPATDSQDQQ